MAELNFHIFLFHMPVANEFHSSVKWRAEARCQKKSHNAKETTGKLSEETFDNFLAGEGMLEACEDHAIKEVIAEQLATAMREQGITKFEMAARMKTSRSQLDRLLDPKISSVALDTLRRAASAAGRRLRLELI